MNVYFTSSTRTELVAVFKSDDVYAICATALEKEAKKRDMKLVGSKEGYVVINGIGLAAELAHYHTRSEMIDKGLIFDEDEMYNGENYTSTAQDLFNVKDMIYLDLIEKETEF